MKLPTAAIADGETPSRHALRDLLGALWPELRVVGESGDGIEALRLLGA